MRKWYFGFTLVLFLVACNAHEAFSPVHTQSVEMPTSSPFPAAPATQEYPQPTATLQPPLGANQTVTLTTLYMVSEMTGWGIDAGGHILRTMDGGNTWKDVSPEPGAYDRGGFFPFHGNQAWATPTFCANYDCTTNPTETYIWRTSDGGMTWQPSQMICLKSGDCGIEYWISADQVSPRALQFVDEKTGWLLLVVHHGMNQDYYRIYQTNDGGIAWTLLTEYKTNIELPYTPTVTGLAFLNTQTGWLGISYSSSFHNLPDYWNLHVTRDEGLTWEMIRLPSPTASSTVCDGEFPGGSALNLSALPPQVIDATLYCYVRNSSTTGAPPASYYFHYHSTDAGQSWRSIQVTSSKHSGDALPRTGNAQFIDADVGWALVASETMGSNLLKRTNDGGLTWGTNLSVDWEDAQFDFVDTQRGWAIVTRSNATLLVQTMDGGLTWTEITPRMVP
jgi:photosystem II stability/assembly factor-like uncharacterized protein